MTSNRTTNAAATRRRNTLKRAKRVQDLYYQKHEDPNGPRTRFDDVIGEIADELAISEDTVMKDLKRDVRELVD